MKREQHHPHRKTPLRFELELLSELCAVAGRLLEVTSPSEARSPMAGQGRAAHRPVLEHYPAISSERPLGIFHLSKKKRKSGPSEANIFRLHGFVQAFASGMAVTGVS